MISTLARDITHEADIESVESLVVNAAVITALLLSFVVCNIVGNTNDAAWDRVTFKQAMYSWPNRDFQEFVIWTLEQEGASMAMQIDQAETMDIAETIRGLPIAETMSWGRGQSVDAEMIIEWVLPIFPMRKLRTWLLRHADDMSNMATYSIGIWFFQTTTAAVLLSTVAFVAALLAYISLTLSGARKDISGKVLENWSAFGIPAILFIYTLAFIALVIYMTSLGAAMWGQDNYLFQNGATYTRSMTTAFPPLCLLFGGLFLRGNFVARGARFDTTTDVEAGAPSDATPTLANEAVSDSEAPQTQDLDGADLDVTTGNPNDGPCLCAW